MDDGELGAAGVVGHGDDLEFDSPVIRPEVQQLIANEDGLARVDQGGEDVGITDLVLPARPSHPHSHWSSVSYTDGDADTVEDRRVEEVQAARTLRSLRPPESRRRPGRPRVFAHIHSRSANLVNPEYVPLGDARLRRVVPRRPTGRRPANICRAPSLAADDA